MIGFYATMGLMLVLAAMAGILRLPRRRRESVAERYFRNAVAVWRKERWLRKIRALVRPVRSESQRQAGDEQFRKMVNGCDRTIEKGEAVQMDPAIGKIKPIAKAKGYVRTLFEQLAKPVDETPLREGRVRARAKEVRTLFCGLRRDVPALCAAEAYQFAAMAVFGGFPPDRLGFHAARVRSQLPEYLRAATFMATLTAEAHARRIPVPQMTLGIRSLCECKPGVHPWQAMFAKVKL